MSVGGILSQVHVLSSPTVETEQVKNFICSGVNKPCTLQLSSSGPPVKVTGQLPLSHSSSISVGGVPVSQVHSFLLSSYSQTTSSPSLICPNSSQFGPG